MCYSGAHAGSGFCSFLGCPSVDGGFVGVLRAVLTAWGSFACAVFHWPGYSVESRGQAYMDPESQSADRFAEGFGTSLVGHHEFGIDGKLV